MTRSVRDELLELCAAFAGAVPGNPFGEQMRVFKVGGKMFALVGLEGEPGTVNLKAEPGDVRGLIETHAAIGPGYHMSKRHWVTVQLDGSLPEGLLAELVEDSYDLVVDGLPARLRP